jgi:hypothetical protein
MRCELPHREANEPLLEWVMSEESEPDNDRTTMFFAIIVTFIITAALGHALGGGLRGGAIVRRPYSNRYNAAAGARNELDS